MTNDAPDEEFTALDEDIRAEVADAGLGEHESAVHEAISNVARSHHGRAVDEIQSVLRQSVQAVTGDLGSVPDRAIEKVAQRIADSSSHA
jgi:hypothetical protein